MKIGITCPASFPATQFGGIMFLAFDIAKEVKKQGHDTTIYTTDLDFAKSNNAFNKNLPRIEDYEGIKIKRSHVYAKVKLFFINPGIYNLIKTDKPDIIHAVGIRGFQSFIAAIISKKYKIPLVISDQGGLYTHPDAQNLGLRKILYQLQEPMLKMIIKQATKIIVVNEYEKQIFSNYCELSKLVTISNGIDIDKIIKNPFDFKKHHNISKKFLLFLGRFAHVKGPDILLHAVKQLEVSGKLNNHVIVIMGSDFGYQEKIFRMIKKLNLEKKIIVIKNPTREEVISAYHSCEFLVLPSRWEMSPLTPIEGFVCKKTTISCKAHGIPYVIDDNVNGLLFELENYNDLAEKMLYLLENPKICEKLGMNGYQKTIKENSKERMGRKIIEVYEETITTHNNRT